MSRPLRIEYESAWYHVMNRGLNRRQIFSGDEDFVLFIKTLFESCELFNVFVSAYCLMNTHYHIVINTPEGNISRFMRHLNGVYTQRFNRKYKKDGPLFKGRYKAILIQAEEYLKQVVKYVHLNPLKASIVNDIDKYRWSSHPFYLEGKSKYKNLDISSMLASFSKSKRVAKRRYIEFMDSGLSDEIKDFYSKKSQGSILGDSDFITNIKKKFIKDDKASKLEIKEKRAILSERKVEIINTKICELFKVEKSQLCSAQRGVENLPRLFAISLSRELSGLSFTEIANEYGMNSYKSVASVNFRLKNRINSDKKLKKLYLRLKDVCRKEEI